MVTIVGLIVGFGSIIAAMFLKHIPFGVMNNPAAIVVILVGTVATILNSFTGKELKNIGKLFGKLFASPKQGAEKQIIDEMTNYAAIARKEGFLALEPKIDEISDPFMKKGLKMIVDGSDGEYIQDLMFMEIEKMSERHNLNASMFSSAGTYAPTLGVLGAVFGLIAAMTHIDDTGAMAEAIAAAFIATILGIFTGYVLWNPFATKLRTMSKHEEAEKTLVVEGILSIQRGDPPIKIKEKLLSMLPPKLQEELLKEDKGSVA
ncbi:MAG: flagellar motor stator protein MotA [Defluviitaleaceae bacterium]|nr:flagellar motor stator protein MotA [Defluviitaleaceae bacterium]